MSTHSSSPPTYYHLPFASTSKGSPSFPSHAHHLSDRIVDPVYLTPLTPLAPSSPTKKQPRPAHCALPPSILHPRPLGELPTPPPQPLPVNPMHLYAHTSRGKHQQQQEPHPATPEPGSGSESGSSASISGRGSGWNRGVQEVKMMLDAMDLEIQGDVARMKEGLKEVRTSLEEMRTGETRGGRGLRR
ncbi:hypothetical protein BOTBODRAFT_26112 [Botryobasidium botryosum FD-172 SS1]|uniref:Uncharacterized protein n=1 Tax=Botryobasidium botryosum (strain FD-172 SS1) TaxID=930990 RepID=A0A067N3Y2_BOTB1|nr:hypothetical protein BOTBODRAFT_26112 [Botryobasidium botryosum FD-172 SS1]